MDKLERIAEFQSRTKAFAVELIRFFSSLPKTEEARIIGRQLLRSGTSTGANYRAACRAKSAADFISKMGTVVEEADETCYWLELLEDAAVCSANRTQSLKKEAEELLRILSASLQTARKNSANQRVR